MVSLGMVGQTLIHSCPYCVYFNGADEDKFEAHAKPRMLPFLEGRFPEPRAAELLAEPAR